MSVVYVLGAVAVVVVLWVVLTNNSFVRARNKVEEAWSGVDVQLKRRLDLVPNLVETVKGYATHERSTLDDVISARAVAMATANRVRRAKAESTLSSALAHVQALAEAYPELRASENFQRLEAQLAEVEDEIQAARRIYNSNVEAYNTRIQIFPNSLLAGDSFTRRDFVEIDAAERAVPKVAFG